ncbi:MAG: hypothetical protein F6K01_02055 [Okeania sp. SIO1I7]|nr:hypothetical protein [Okeania sp. SIO1I7]
MFTNREISIRIFTFISCPVASVLYREGKEEGRRKKEEALREGKTLYGAKYFPNFIHKRYQRT